MPHIWCPGCGCDVQHLLRADRRARALTVREQAVRVRERQVARALRLLRSLGPAMEAHAHAKADVRRSVPEIYRLWSDELLAEVEARFPTRPD